MLPEVDITGVWTGECAGAEISCLLLATFIQHGSDLSGVIELNEPGVASVSTWLDGEGDVLRARSLSYNEQHAEYDLHVTWLDTETVGLWALLEQRSTLEGDHYWIVALGDE